MPPPIALQLYTLREIIPGNFKRIIDQVAEIGYVGLEMAAVHGGFSPAEAANIIRAAGLEIFSAHSPLPLGEDKNQALDTLAAYGCTHLVCPWLDPSHYATREAIRKTADLFNQAAQAAQENGLQLSLHNHWFEFEPVDGVPAYQHLLEDLAPEVLFEIDLYWVKTGGVDPAVAMKELAQRAPLLHVKDGPADAIESPMVAVGQGTLDFHAILPLGGEHTEVHIVELDRCATDMLTAVRESYEYLVGNGLSRGNQ